MSLVLLKKACTRCRASSIKTYWANIKALSKLAGQDELPGGGKWINGKLLARVREMPLQRLKRFAAAGVKAAQMYGVERPKWSQLLTEASDKYAKKRMTGTRTKREAANWPEGGYAALGKLAKDLHLELMHLEKKARWNKSDLYHYQKYLIVLFYSRHALRGDLADVKHKKPFGTNWIQKTGSKYKLHVGEHKTSKSHGPIKVDLGAEIGAALDTFLPHAKRLTKHGYLLSTLRTQNRLQRADMLRLIRNTTKDRLGKNIGVQLIRVLKVTGALREIDAAESLQKEMGHGPGMQKKYISRSS
jgi:hypothetical protein